MIRPLLLSLALCAVPLRAQEPVSPDVEKAAKESVVPPVVVKEAIPEMVPEIKPEPKPEAKPEPVPEAKPEPAIEKVKAAVKEPKQSKHRSAAESLDAEWGFLKESSEDSNTELRDVALEDLRIFILKYPDSQAAPEALALSAGILAKKADYKSALVEWLRLFYEYPNSTPAQSRSVFNDLADKRFGRKLKPALTALGQVPESSDKADRLAQLVFNLSGAAADSVYEPAIAEARRFQARFPAHKDSDRVQWSIAEIHAKNGKDADALLAYRKLLAVYSGSPFRAQAQFAVAGLFADRFKDYRRAIKAYEELVEQYPESAQVQPALERAAVLHADKLKQYDSAVQLYEKIVKLFPKSDGALKAYNAEAKLQRDRMTLSDEAIKTYRRLAGEFGPPAAVEALQNAALIARKDLKNYNLEAELRRKIAADFPSAKEAADELFAAAEIQADDIKDDDKAMAAYKEVGAKFPGTKQAQKAQERIAKLEKKKQ